jgi:hypothetical protein
VFVTVRFERGGWKKIHLLGSSAKGDEGGA